MKEDKDRQSQVSTCLEGPACAEMIQKLMGEQGTGTLYEEMMRSLMKKTSKDPDEDQGSK